ncbi:MULTISPECIES: MBG domain-containing protein [Methylobacterium]|uniref:MBG domain-containing protein n=1 Tax=Methylobacterium TaxID=407 RepID=UPI003757D79E
MSYVGADLSVTARPPTLTADTQSRVYGDSNPALTCRVGGRGLVHGDTLTGTLVTPADGNSLPGQYTRNRGSLTAAANDGVTISEPTSRSPRDLQPRSRLPSLDQGQASRASSSAYPPSRRHLPDNRPSSLPVSSG